jgi:GNAT superfamily N-acetyltransferase
MQIRERTETDLDQCEAIVQMTHEQDGYPPWVGDDLRSLFLEPPALQAWVAVADGRVIGHVALAPRASDPVMDMACSVTGAQAAQLGVVARLVVSRASRRSGVARTLLETATEAAHARGLIPVLDVLPRFVAAIALYEASGWIRVGSVVFVASDGARFDEYVYVGPSPAA